VERREFMKKAALTGAALLGSRIPIIEPASAASGSASPDCLWGIHAEPNTRGGTLYTAITHAEQLAGRRFAVDRQYHRWDTPLPSSYEVWTRTHGRTPYVSWNSYWIHGGPVAWKGIADGLHNPWIVQQAQSIKRWGHHMYLTFNHEPENDASRCGSSAEYRAALSHIISVFRSQGVSNVTWLVTLMAPTFSGNNGGVHNWLPWVPYDIVGVDGYNRWPCFSDHGHKSFYDLFAPAHSFATSARKPLAICEYGTIEATSCGYPGSPASKATWFRNAAGWIQEWNNVAFAAYSHVEATYRGRWMDFYINSSPQALAAFRQIGLSPYFA